MERDLGKPYSLVLGGSYEQLPLISEWKDRGFGVIVADINQSSEGSRIADIFIHEDISNWKSIVTAVQGLNVTHVSSIASQIGAISSAWIAKSLGLLGADPDIVQRIADKGAVRQLLEKAEIRQPEFVVVVDEKVTKVPDKPKLIVKPADRSGSRGVSLVTDPSQLRLAVSNANSVSFSNRVIVEEYIEGKQYDVSLLATGKGTFAVATIRENYSKEGFLPLTYEVPSGLKIPYLKTLQEYALRVSGSLGYTFGAAHCEVRLDKDGTPWLVEFDPRMGGEEWNTLIKMATGFNYVGSLVDLYLGIHAEPITPSAYQRARLRYLYEGLLIDQVQRLSTWIEVFSRDFRPGLELGSTTELKPVGYVLEKGVL